MKRGKAWNRPRSPRHRCRPRFLSAPTGLRAIAADGQVTLEWNSVTGASSYFVYRATVSGINRDNWNTIVGGNRTQVPGGATVYIEDSLTNGTTYFFVVTAQNSLGQSEESAEVSATPFAADTVPVQPTNLTASAADSEIILHWNAAAGAQFYNVYWGTAAGVTPDNGTKISNLSGTSYTHTALTNNYHLPLHSYSGECPRGKPSVRGGLGDADSDPAPGGGDVASERVC
ncbi:MAG: fibronectin type III domain-containing protein [Candidatus Manganitrophus sp.]|nr:fibronectin type III domain-containing protein [Candidatus Manganitrophus sp.]